MKKSTGVHINSTVLVTLVIVSLAVFGFRPSAAAPAQETTNVLPGPKLVLRAGHTEAPAPYVPARNAFPSAGIDSATITVNYIGPWDTPARNAFQFAVDIWAAQIISAVEIRVDAEWSALLPNVLGQAGATTVHRNFSGAPMNATWYPAALANALSGSDLYGDVEITAEFNRNFADWYFGTDGATPIDKWDFTSVVLHELGHGLGFAGSMRVSSGIGTWGLYGDPFIYDRFTENGAGQLLISAFPNGSTALAAQLQSGNIFFNGAQANAANGGSRPGLYAPNPWRSGSSYSHLAETFNGTPNALMTFSIDNGEAIHDPGTVTRGMFQDMGWTIGVQPKDPDLELTKSISGGPEFSPGDPITFVLSVKNLGTGDATGVVLTDNLPVGILAPFWVPSGALSGATARGGTSFVWDLPDLAPGEIGAININATIDPGLTANFAIVNTASISTQANEPNTANNSGTTIVGGERIYLPAIVSARQ